MKKKYFILALTFLCLLMSERSFGQEFGSNGVNSEYRPPVECASCDLKPAGMVKNEGASIEDAIDDLDIPGVDVSSGDYDDGSDGGGNDGGDDDGGGDDSSGNNVNVGSWGGGSGGISIGGNGGGGSDTSGGYGGNPYNDSGLGQDNYYDTASTDLGLTFTSNNSAYLYNGPSYSSAGGEVYIKITNYTYKKPSELDPNNPAHSMALKQFAAMLARNLNDNNYTISIAVNPDNVLSSKSQASTNEFTITLNSNGGFSKDLDNVNNFKSVLKHEIFHVDDNRDPNFVRSLSTHADVYIKQANHATYKDTKLDFQIGNAGSFVNYLLNMDKNSAFDKRDITNKITEFNKNAGKVQIVFPIMNYAKGTLQLNLSVNRIPTNYIDYEKINE